MQCNTRFGFVIFCFIAGVSFFSCHSSVETVENKKIEPVEKKIQRVMPEIVEYDLPKEITLCGETIDLTQKDNFQMFEREFIISVWDRAQVFMWVKRAGQYFPYLEKRLKEAGLPDDLKYLVVAESSMHTHIRSKAGALGFWQFMEDTGKRYGLRIERGVVDERLCYERSTDAAISYIQDLKEKFKTWLLVMAAYNCGEHKLNAALKIQQEGYVDLHLPRETERYIYRIAAIRHVMQNADTYGYRIHQDRLYEPVETENVPVSVGNKKRFYISDFVKLVGIGYKEFMDYNPQLLSSLLPTGNYELKAPKGYTEKYRQALTTMKSPEYRESQRETDLYYTVQPGDVLYTISWETGVPVKRIKRLNKIRGARIYPGQKLRLK